MNAQKSQESQLPVGVGLDVKSENTEEQKPGQKRRVQIFQDSEQKDKKPKARPLTAEEKILKKKTQGKFIDSFTYIFTELNATTRWMADSAFTTYFGKPAFHPYGKGNVNPANPALKMLTHNINACTGRQKAEY